MSPEAGLLLLRAEHLRCLDSIELLADPAQNIIVGENGAGKTSILEAIYYLGRGKSFRPGPASMLIQTGQTTFTIFGEVAEPSGRHRLGISHGRDGLQAHFDTQAQATLADLASALPVQIIDPEVHQLIQGGPQGRREFVDWGVFHVKHEFINEWRRYRRALKQRNAALKQGLAKQAVMAWDPELIESGLEIDAARREYVSTFMPLMSSISTELLLNEANYYYLPGWASTDSFSEALSASWERDCTYGATQVGPHRAELSIQSDGQAARNRLSRGQQKLLSIALVLAQSIFVARSQKRKVTLLVDEPAAELDTVHVHKLFEILSCEELQLFISTLDLDALPVTGGAKVFHVERGALSTLI
ncbi:MAG: DNA replication/repair protein RecF [Gammaproteobacteria bacterium]|jgi:DNA replication and repair protein RecF|nr:DNA replication/repair protein RecF [Chromatiales bacterium]MDP6673738.1 DNA replication/repair protein RecF [Gammaproteobacteria bacterium]